MSLPGYQWVSNARNAGGTYADAGYYPYKPRILLHMTVGMGISASYISGHSVPPHLWANPYDRALYQTVELDRSAFALYQPNYGYHWTNKAAYCLQTELVGVPVVNQTTYTDAQLRWIAAEVVVPQERWLRARGLTANIGNYRYHTNSSGSASVDWSGRMGEQDWADFNGLCAHIDCWGNDHWDCSVERLDLISRYALEILGGEPTQPPTSSGGVLDFMATNDQAWKLLNDIWNYLQAFHAEAAQQHSDVGGAFAELRTGRGHQDAASQQRHSDVAGAFAELRTGRTAQNVELGHLTHLDPGTSKLADANLSDTGRLAALQTSVDDIEPGTGSGGGIPRAELIAAIKEALQGAKITFG